MFKQGFLAAGALATAALLWAPEATAAPVYGGMRSAHVGGYHPAWYHPSYNPAWYHGSIYSAARPYYNHYHPSRYIYNPWYVPWYYGSFYTNPTYYANYYAGPTYTPPAYVPYTPPALSYQSYYAYPPGSSAPTLAPGPLTRTPTDVTPPAAAPAQEASTAQIQVRVPDPNAEIVVDGARTTQRGTDRSFVSPPLTPGQKYQYQIEARWTQDGKEVSQTRNVTIRAGDRVNVDFTAPAGDDGKPKPAVP